MKHQFEKKQYYEQATKESPWISRNKGNLVRQFKSQRKIDTAAQTFVSSVDVNTTIYLHFLRVPLG
jgi:hypothetical protein